jgi:4-amino-4-deoxy-L-arabinose transferase-like glycosyltransferase
MQGIQEAKRGAGEARWSRIDTGLCAALALAALAVRLPELLTLPAFRDELAEVVRGLHIYRGLSYPLTNEALDIGAFFNYLVALLFAGAGPDPYTPRLLVTMFGAATAALTYALARMLTGARLPALLAGSFLATNSMHILIGHVAWSNCMTPFWTTATLLALATGRTRRRPDGLPGTRALLLAGLCAGLALQTHSSVVVFLLGIGVWLWWPGPAWRLRLRRPAFWGFHGMFLLAYTNMIIFNILNPLASWYHVVEHKGYALAGAAPGSATVALGAGYPDNLLALLVEWVRANSADTINYDSVARYLADPQMIVYGALLVAGVVLAVRRKYWLLLAPIACGVLILPLFNRDYQFEIHTRYIGFLLPLGAILTAFAACRRGCAPPGRMVPSQPAPGVGGGGHRRVAGALPVARAGRLLRRGKRRRAQQHRRHRHPGRPGGDARRGRRRVHQQTAGSHVHRPGPGCLGDPARGNDQR